MYRFTLVIRYVIYLFYLYFAARDDGVYGLRCVWCGDGSRFAVAQSSGKVYLFHLVGRVPTLMDVVVAGDRTAWVWDCGWDFGGKLLVTANSAGFIKFWEENKVGL